jgi:hypothetical protein
MPMKGTAGRDKITFVIVKFKRTNQKKIGCKETISTDSPKNRVPHEKSPQNQKQESN